MSSRHLSWGQSTILHQKGDSLKHILHLARLPRDSSTGVFLTSEFSIINSKTFFKNGVSGEGGSGWKIKRLYVCGLAVKPSQMQEPDTQIDTETEKNQLNFMRRAGAVRTPSNTVLWLHKTCLWFMSAYPLWPRVCDHSSGVAVASCKALWTWWAFFCGLWFPAHCLLSLSAEFSQYSPTWHIL